eukprot:2900297-Heterocapsa_arctica.AAC.1
MPALLYLPYARSREPARVTRLTQDVFVTRESNRGQPAASLLVCCRRCLCCRRSLRRLSLLSG